MAALIPANASRQQSRLAGPRSGQHADEVDQAPRLRPHNDSAITPRQPCDLVAGLQAQVLAYFTQNRDLAFDGHFGWLGHVEVYLYDLDFRKSAGSRGQHMAIMRSAPLTEIDAQSSSDLLRSRELPIRDF